MVELKYILKWHIFRCFCEFSIVYVKEQSSALKKLFDAKCTQFASVTKSYHWDFVLKSVVIGENKDFQVELGPFQGHFWTLGVIFVTKNLKIA